MASRHPPVEPGQRREKFPVAHAGDGAARERRRADLLIRQHPEQLAEAGKLDGEHLLHHIGGDVARSDAGAAGDDNRIEVAQGSR